MDRAIRFAPGDSVRYCTAAGQATAAESDVVVPTLQPGYCVDRGMLLGAQALAHVYGKNQGSDTYANWMEHRYNFDRNLEVAGEVMCGKAKLRFDVPDSRGNKIPTDNGVMVLDTVVNLNT